MTPFESRQVFFLSFVYSTKDKNYGVLDEIKLKSDPYIINLRQQIINEKREKDTLLKSLAKEMGVAVETLPTNESLSGFVKNNIYDITIIMQGKSKLIKRKPKYPQHKHAIIIDLTNQIDEHWKSIRKQQLEIKELTSRDSAIKKSRIERNTEFLQDASVYLTESFKSVSEVEYIDSIKLVLNRMTQTSLELFIKLKNNVITTPIKLFSEGNYDLMVLLLYVSIIRVGANKGQAKVLLMDDVFQSIDSTIRMKFMNYILEVLKDWQLIMLLPISRQGLTFI